MEKSLRLDKYLANMSVGTRSEVKDIIKSKRVKVNGEIVKLADFKVSKEDEILVDDKPVSYIDFEYYILNKPAGYLTATEDKKDPVVMELLKSKRKDLFPVGRLDKDTEGLLLITNDGVLGHDLLMPKNHVDKKYYVEVSSKLRDDAEELFSKPMEFKDFTSSPAKYERLSDTSAYLTIHEGKFHQVKKMFERIGSPVIYLKRVEFAFLNLEGLEIGEFRELREDEVNRLKELTK